jgi:transcription elongation factor GreA
MDEKPVHVTRDGLHSIEEELDTLLRERPEMAERIRAARDFGDIAENAEYTEAKNEQGLLEGRIQRLEAILRNAVLIEEEPREHGVVALGANVRVRFEDGEEEQVYSIVGAAEADPLEGKISDESPLGMALLSHRAGDEVVFESPMGSSTLLVMAVS